MMLPLQPSKRNIFPLLQLPRELRDQIYRHSILTGDISILEISKQVNKEASQLLSKHAVLRINLGFPDRTNWSKLGSASMAAVQRMDLRIKASEDAVPFDNDVISHLLDKQVIRESCVVTLHYGKEVTVPDLVYCSGLYRMLARLSGFKNLVFKIVTERYEAAEFQGSFTEKRFHELFPYDLRLLNFHRETYVRVQKYFESGFGPAKFDDSVEGHCLEFHPLEPVPENWSPEGDDDGGFL